MKDAIPLAAALRAAVTGIDAVLASVIESLDLLEDAIGCLDVLVGSSQADVEQTLGSFGQAAQTGKALVADVTAVRVSVVKILARVAELLGDGESLLISGTRQGAQDPVDQVRSGVGRTPVGAQTRGVWVRDDGTIEELQSGQQTPWFAEALRQLRVLGGPAGRALTRLATHIEVQMVLVRMGRGDVGNDVTLVLSRRPCGTPPDMVEPFTCHSQLANLIKAAGRPLKLKVVDPDGKIWLYPKGSTPE